MQVETGQVAEFDEAGGYGTVVGEGGEAHFFHCTAIADGSRHIDVGAEVQFTVVAGRRGLWEAVEIRARPDGA